MGDKFKKFVEDGTDSQYVPLGSKCDLCGKKLGIFYTGFWSCNSKHVFDGVLCPKCAGQIEILCNEMQTWMPKEMYVKWRRFAKYNWQSMSLEQVRTLLALKEENDRERLEAYGANAEALFRVEDAFQIAPKPLEVGMFRVNKLKNRTVVFGRVDQGVLRKADAVRIDHEGQLTETSILEAYVYDPDAPDNDFDVCLRASGGKQRLSENQVGWLILDHAEKILPGDRIVK